MPLNPGATDLQRIVARVESSDRISAVRLEPAILRHYTSGVLSPQEKGALAACSHACGCDYDAARHILASSHGLFQIMGYALYGSLGWDGPIADFYYKTDQSVWFERFLQSRAMGNSWVELAQDPDGLLSWVARYNGTARIFGYVSHMIDAARALGIPAPSISFGRP